MACITLKHGITMIHIAISIVDGGAMRLYHKIAVCVFLAFSLIQPGCKSDSPPSNVGSYLVDTGQTGCYSANAAIGCPAAGQAFHGQDAQYSSAQMSYRDNGDGTVTDLVTGLMWQKAYGAKTSLDAAMAAASSQATGGHRDWRAPTIKELYTLINFNGRTGLSEADAQPYIDTTVFDFVYGNTGAGERYIDAQYLSSTTYTSVTMQGAATVFGVNFADGRIKGYPRYGNPGGAGGSMFVRYVRGGGNEGSSYQDNGNQTVTDNSTGLIWLKGDSLSMGAGTLDWQAALAWCENLDFAGRADWRLPNAKELQGIVDYSRSPAATGSAAIDPVFTASRIMVEGGNTGYGFYWTSTTHLDGVNPGEYAVYIAFGEALGFMPSPQGGAELMDVHGAGAQRSDPKSGDPGQYPQGHGPQGDVVRIYNLARCVCGGL